MRGYVDRFDSTIAGWAFDPAAPGQAVEIVIEHEGKELYRSSADLLREDLIPVIGEGYHGFMFDPPAKAGFDKNMHLQVFAVSRSRVLLYEGHWAYRRVVIEGTDRWLFLNDDSNNVNLRIAGKIGIEPESIYRTALQFALREAFLARLGIPYLPLILPEKNVACAKFFPELQVSSSRPVPLILDQIKRMGCRAVYPIAEFLASDVELFYRTDTHANTHGYNLIYQILQRELPEFFSGAKLPEPVFNQSFCGDLGEKMSPVHFEAVDEYLHPSTAHHFYTRDRIDEVIKSGNRLRGEVVSVFNRNGKRRLLVFGASSAYHLLPLISCAFEHTLLVWENTFDYRVIETYKPDCILWLPPERFFPMTVDDLNGLPETLKIVQDLM